MGCKLIQAFSQKYQCTMNTTDWTGIWTYITDSNFCSNNCYAQTSIVFISSHFICCVLSGYGRSWLSANPTSLVLTKIWFLPSVIDPTLATQTCLVGYSSLLSSYLLCVLNFPSPLFPKNFFRVTLRVLLVPCNTELPAVYSGYGRLNRIPH